jgi:hypothetical protein
VIAFSKQCALSCPVIFLCLLDVCVCASSLAPNIHSFNDLPSTQQLAIHSTTFHHAIRARHHTPTQQVAIMQSCHLPTCAAGLQDKTCRFDGPDGVSECPTEEELQRLGLKSGCNQCVVVVSALNGKTMMWEQQEEVRFAIFLWDVFDRCVCARLCACTPGALSRSTERHVS